MGKIVDEARSLKRSARDESKQGNHAAAAEVLRDCINALEGALAAPEGDAGGARQSPAPAEAEKPTEIAAELADAYGMLGGALRKQGELARAAAAYDRGARYESDPRYGIVNTYNALNRLVTRVLMCPRSLSEPDALRALDDVEFVDVPGKLIELQAELGRQLDGPRARDFWAAGDLAFTCALNGDEPGALDAFERFASLKPPAYAYDAYVVWIDAAGDLDTPRKGLLNKVKALFEHGSGSASDEGKD